VNAPVELPPKGLPEHLPEGEHIVWQGAPDGRGLAQRTFHVRKVALYLGMLLLWRIAAQVAEDHPAGDIVMSALLLALVAMAAVGILTSIAWLMGRTTVYTITNRRVAMRIGVALPLTLNLPYRAIETVRMRRYADGSGELTLVLGGPNRIAYLQLWPHARPWHMSRPEPALRCIADVERVGGLLADAMAGTAGVTSARTAGEAARPRAQAAAQDRYTPAGLAGEGST